MTEHDERPATSWFDRILDFLCDLSMLIAGVALVVLTVIFGWLVYGRYVLNSTPTWVEQVSLLLVMLIGFLGASVGIHKNSHLGVSFFREICPKPIQIIFEVATHIILIVFGGLMLVKGYELTVFKWGSQIPLINVPEGFRSIPIMVCGLLTGLYSIGHLIHVLTGVPRPPSDITE